MLSIFFNCKILDALLHFEFLVKILDKKMLLKLSSFITRLKLQTFFSQFLEIETSLNLKLN